MERQIRINTERAHVYSPDVHVGMAADISIPVDEKALRDVLSQVCRRHPLLTAALSFDKENAAYYRMDSAPPIEPEIVENADWRAWMNRVNQAPFDLEKGPLLRVLAANSGDGGTIALLGHHIIGDGRSFLYLIRDFLLALDGRLGGECLQPPIIQGAEAFPAATAPGFLTSLLAKKLNRDYRKSGKRFSGEDYRALYQKYRREKKPALYTASLSREETERLIKNCHAHGVTVNQAVSTAFVAARRTTGITSDYLGVSCDVRSELRPNPGECMGNFASGVMVSARYDDRLDFWENSRKIRALLDKKLKDKKKRLLVLRFCDLLDDTLQDASNFAGQGLCGEKSAQTLSGILSGVPASEGLGISNLGRHEAQYTHFSLRELYFIPPLFPSNDFVVGVLTTNERLTFCLRYAAGRIDELAVKKLFEEAAAHMLS